MDVIPEWIALHSVNVYKQTLHNTSNHSCNTALTSDKVITSKEFISTVTAPHWKPLSNQILLNYI